MEQTTNRNFRGGTTHSLTWYDGMLGQPSASSSSVRHPVSPCLATVITFSEVQFRFIYAGSTIAPLRPLRSQNAFVFHDGAFWRDVEADPSVSSTAPTR